MSYKQKIKKKNQKKRKLKKSLNILLLIEKKNETIYIKIKYYIIIEKKNTMNLL